jgi:serine/threonine-protein kinase
VAVWELKPPELRQVSRFYYELPKDQQFIQSYPGLAVSPDGRQFAYSTNKGLYLRSMDELDARLIPGSDENPLAPFFSPDGQWLGYWSRANNQLKKISIKGGVPVALCDASFAGGANWGVDNMIVYPEPGRGIIMRVSANGGTAEEIFKAEGERFTFPQILPDGKTVLFSLNTRLPYQVVVQSLKLGKRKVLFTGGDPRYLPTGHLVYTLGNNLFAIPFDLDRLEVVGGPVPMVEGIWHSGTGPPQYAISDSGTLVYIPGTTGPAAPGRTPVWVDRNGKEEPLAVPPNAYVAPKISPDGTRVALTIPDTDGYDIWIWDLIRKTMTRLTFHKKNNLQSIWTPDGKRIVYESDRESGFGGVYWKSADGTGEDEKLASAPDRWLLPCSWSSDGKTLIMTEATVDGKYDIWVLSMEGDRVQKPLLQHEGYKEAQPKISPDSRWMAYMSDESGQNEIYVRPFPEVNKGRWQVSTSGGGWPLWSPNGRELFYLSSDSVMAVSVQTEPSFSLGTPRALFRSTYVSNGPLGVALWDISPDGKRFLMMKELQSTTSAGGAPLKINIVLNWLEELKQRVPAK